MIESNASAQMTSNAVDRPATGVASTAPLTAYHACYYAHELTKLGEIGELDRLSTTLFDSKVDLNPHQVEAALFAMSNPLLKGTILADEVGLGKTIEAGLLLCQKWAERRRKLIVVVPAHLRKQWQSELAEKFNLPAVVMDRREWGRERKAGHPNPFDTDKIVVVSYGFASRMKDDLRSVPFDLVVMDEAHKLRNAYLKTPRIFGFHGVYKRLAIHAGLVDVHLGPRVECDYLVTAWAKDAGYDGLAGARPLLDRWRRAVESTMSQRPMRTRTGWRQDDWEELARLMAPGHAGRREKRVLRELLHANDDRGLGALPEMWRMQEQFEPSEYSDPAVHRRLRSSLPQYGALLDAIETYEGFARSVTDGFDILRAEAAREGSDSRRVCVPSTASRICPRGIPRSARGRPRGAIHRTGRINDHRLVQLPTVQGVAASPDFQCAGSR